MSREEELSESVRSFWVLYNKTHKGFKEKDAMKNAWESQRRWNLIKSVIIFILTVLFHF